MAVIGGEKLLKYVAFFLFGSENFICFYQGKENILKSTFCGNLTSGT